MRVTVLAIAGFAVAVASRSSRSALGHGISLFGAGTSMAAGGSRRRARHGPAPERRNPQPGRARARPGRAPPRPGCVAAFAFVGWLVSPVVEDSCCGRRSATPAPRRCCARCCCPSTGGREAGAGRRSSCRPGLEASLSSAERLGPLLHPDQPELESEPARRVEARAVVGDRAARCHPRRAGARRSSARGRGGRRWPPPRAGSAERVLPRRRTATRRSMSSSRSAPSRSATSSAVGRGRGAAARDGPARAEIAPRVSSSARWTDSMISAVVSPVVQLRPAPCICDEMNASSWATPSWMSRATRRRSSSTAAAPRPPGSVEITRIVPMPHATTAADPEDVADVEEVGVGGGEQRVVEVRDAGDDRPDAEPELELVVLALGPRPNAAPAIRNSAAAPDVGDEQLGVLAREWSSARSPARSVKAAGRSNTSAITISMPSAATQPAAVSDERAPPVAQDPLGRERGGGEQRRAEHACARRSARSSGRPRSRSGSRSARRRPGSCPPAHDARERQQVGAAGRCGGSGRTAARRRAAAPARRGLLRDVQRAVLVGRLGGDSTTLSSMASARRPRAISERTHDRTRPRGDRAAPLRHARAGRLCWCADVGTRRPSRGEPKPDVGVPYTPGARAAARGARDPDRARRSREGHQAALARRGARRVAGGSVCGGRRHVVLRPRRAQHDLRSTHAASTAASPPSTTTP